MFPPVEEAVLQNNPKFAALHKTLTSTLLNPNGSTKNHPSQAERDARVETLGTLRINGAKSAILRTSIRSMSLNEETRKEPLPAELLELVVLLSIRLSAESLPQPSLDLIASTELHSSLPEHLPKISALISSHLHTQALTIARILNPTTNASYLHRSIPKMPSTLAALQKTIATKKSSLESSRLALVPLTMKVLDKYRTASELTISILEQNKHGLLSRASKAQAELLSAQAQQELLSVKSAYFGAQNAVYTPQVRSALETYVEHLRDGRSRLRQRGKDAETELRRYGLGREEKEKIMREIARVYGHLNKEMEEVNRDMERLKTS